MLTTLSGVNQRANRTPLCANPSHPPNLILNTGTMYNPQQSMNN